MLSTEAGVASAADMAQAIFDDQEWAASPPPPTVSPVGAAGVAAEGMVPDEIGMPGEVDVGSVPPAGAAGAAAEEEEEEAEAE